MTTSPRLTDLVLAALANLTRLPAQTPSVSNRNTRAQVGTGGDSDRDGPSSRRGAGKANGRTVR